MATGTDVESFLFGEGTEWRGDVGTTTKTASKGKATRRPITVTTFRTLEEFSVQNFALGSKKDAAENKKHPLWSFSKVESWRDPIEFFLSVFFAQNPIKRPLLKSLVKKDGRPTENGLDAMKMFLNILSFTCSSSSTFY